MKPVDMNVGIYSILLLLLYVIMSNLSTDYSERAACTQLESQCMQFCFFFSSKISIHNMMKHRVEFNQTVKKIKYLAWIQHIMPAVCI